MPLELELHLPIAPEEQREQEAIREDPRRRIREAHRVESEHRNQRQRHKSARDHLENSRENRDLGESHALYQEPHDIHERERNVERSVAYQELLRQVEYFSDAAAVGVVYEQHGDIPAKHKNDQEPDDGINRAQ